MKKYNGAIIIIALAAFVAILLSLYNGNPNWKIYLLGTIIFIILYISISYEKIKINKT